MTADEMMDYRGKGNGVFIRATETPHSAAPDPAMLEKCTVAKWSQRAPAASRWSRVIATDSSPTMRPLAS